MSLKKVKLFDFNWQGKLYDLKIEFSMPKRSRNYYEPDDEAELYDIMDEDGFSFMHTFKDDFLDAVLESAIEEYDLRIEIMMENNCE